MNRKLIFLTFLIALSVGSVVAQQKTDFSGTWKLNLTKSEFGVLPPPESRTDVITHKDPSLSDSVTQEGAEGKQQYTANYTIDGKEATNMIGPREVKTAVKWAGSSLAMTSKFQYESADVLGDNTWTLSADGKTLTMSIHYTSSIGDADQKFVFDKQDGGAATAPATKP
jgi:hypothetical protein